MMMQVKCSVQGQSISGIFNKTSDTVITAVKERRKKGMEGGMKGGREDHAEETSGVSPRKKTLSGDVIRFGKMTTSTA